MPRPPGRPPPETRRQGGPPGARSPGVGHSCRAVTVTLTCATTSRWSLIGTENSPRCFSGSSSWIALVDLEPPGREVPAMSAAVTDPYSASCSPTRRAIVHSTAERRAACASASAFSAASRASTIRCSRSTISRCPGSPPGRACGAAGSCARTRWPPSRPRRGGPSCRRAPEESLPWLSPPSRSGTARAPAAAPA